MANYNSELQAAYTDMLQTPVIEHHLIDFRCEPQKLHENRSNLKTAANQLVADIKLNMDNGCIRMRRDKRNHNDGLATCNGTNKISKLDMSAIPLNINSISPHLKSPLNDIHISPMDLSSPILNQGISSDCAISDFTILDMTLNATDSSVNGHVYDEHNLGIKIAKSFLGQPDDNLQTPSPQLNMVPNHFPEATLTLLDDNLNSVQPDSTIEDVVNRNTIVDFSPLNITESKFAANTPSGRKGKDKTKKSKDDKAQTSYQCFQCKRVYKWKFNLNRHLKFECNKENAFECTRCGQKFPYKQNCTQHISRTHHIKLENNEQYITLGHIKIHATLDTYGKATAKPLMKTEETYEFECGMCAHRLSYQQSIIEHLNRVHNMYSTSEEAYVANGLIKFVKR